MTEDKVVGWHHWHDGHEFEQALGVGDGQGSLVCYSSRGCKESDTTECLNNRKCGFVWWLNRSTKFCLKAKSYKVKIFLDDTGI